LAGLAALYADLVAALFGTTVPLPAPCPVSQVVQAQLAAGVPLFRTQPPLLNHELLVCGWMEVCQTISRHRDAADPEKLARAVAAGVLSLTQALRTIFDHGPSDFVRILRDDGLDTKLGTSVLRLAALPVLAAQVTVLQSSWQKVDWPHGYCPACGSWPLLAEFRGLEQFRWLRCGLCGSGWQVDRIFCPFCEARDHRQLLDLFVEGREQKHRVNVCNGCRGFVRTLCTLTPLTVPELLVAELETLHLELLAIERGYVLPESRAVE
jgi:FdhE protein